MCNKRNTVELRLNGRKIRVDPCIRNLISGLNQLGINTLGCCCGHDEYLMSIIYRSDDGTIKELVSQKTIQRTRRFYKLDNKGFYYIPEIYKD